MSQNIPGSPILKISSKRNETLLRTLHVEVCIHAVYAKTLRLVRPTPSLSHLLYTSFPLSFSPSLPHSLPPIPVVPQEKEPIAKNLLDALYFILLSLKGEWDWKWLCNFHLYSVLTSHFFEV